MESATFCEVSDLIGVILCGGQSTRMGSDKSLLSFHGEILFKKAFELLQTHCAKTYLSCRADQVANYQAFDTIVDAFEQIGPMGGLASSLQFAQGNGIFVMAVDLPKMDSDTISELICQRDATKNATIFLNKTGLFEPLCGIYEASALQPMLKNIDIGRFSLQSLLVEMKVKVLDVSNEQVWLNWNSMEDFEKKEDEA